MGFDIAGVATLTGPGGNTLSLDGTVANVMKVNASAILTRSITPFMRGQFQGRGAPYNAGGGPLLVTADVNIGSCWNDATGYFTAPVAGYYMATLGAIANQNSGYPNILKNGGGYSQQHWNHTADWHYVSLSAIVNLAANDNICWIIQSPGPATAGFYGNGGHQMFSIALMA